MRRPRLPVVSTVTCIVKPHLEKHIKNEWLQNPRYVPHHTGSIRAGQELRGIEYTRENLVRMGRLELPRVTPLEPKSSASTSFATFAMPRLKPGTVELSVNQAARNRCAALRIRRSRAAGCIPGGTNSKKRPGTMTGPWIGGPSPARTGDLLIKSQLLYQLS